MSQLQFTHPELTWFSSKGLNLQAVINITEAPASFIDNCNQHQIDLSNFSQLILLGHGGKKLWQQIPKSYFSQTNPIDNYSIDCFKQWKSKQTTQQKDMIQSNLLYPSHTTYHFNLQDLGNKVGWHNSSLLKVGINREFGLWFAYRLLVLTNTQFKSSIVNRTENICLTCSEKPCINACPVNAVTESNYHWQDCFSYRKQENSLCKKQCLARTSCPIALENKYDDQQMAYHYQLSLSHLK